MSADDICDLLVIGGGINGAGIARDAAGRGLTVTLAEAGDLAGATSSASTKLVHGGLRYLEFHAYAFVRHSLQEREVLLGLAPHLARPMPFLLPVEPHQRPAWMIRAGLFLYDHLARRREVPGSQAVALRTDPGGPAFRPDLARAFRYWDGWVDDARLVVANVRDAAARGARILVREAVVAAARRDFGWEAITSSGRRIAARRIVNATGPWAGRVAADVLGQADVPRLRLVQGAHIVTRRVNRSADAWLLQQPDGRIIFVIPYEGEYSLIGTTETDVSDPAARLPTAEEEAYLIGAVNRSAARPLAASDVVHRFAGVRPLVLQEGRGARETPRGWQLVPHGALAEPGSALTVLGGKLTTYRLLAEAVLKTLFPSSRPWTRTAALPGGDIAAVNGGHGAGYAVWLADLKAGNPHYDPRILDRMARLYGSETQQLLDRGLGANLGGVFEGELQHMRDAEWARTAEDALWRRSKLGLHLGADVQAKVAVFFGDAVAASGAGSPHFAPAARSSQG